jgi:hypothetical protein
MAMYVQASGMKFTAILPQAQKLSTQGSVFSVFKQAELDVELDKANSRFQRVKAHVLASRIYIKRLAIIANEKQNVYLGMASNPSQQDNNILRSEGDCNPSREQQDPPDLPPGAWWKKVPPTTIASTPRFCHPCPGGCGLASAYHQESVFASDIWFSYCCHRCYQIHYMRSRNRRTRHGPCCTGRSFPKVADKPEPKS